ncbi:glycosyltransferase family 4 protein [Pararhizobium sp. BT-229]|uniref:glycosyltransferase n=1 Tax=Pararhizobium sp. BT-229 TaxID=2986923 RepID=UPI0021F7A684|nr:glycosyltransferase family 4 protein [Pararhizobium sp. BT-229]MCV9962855.1 glycosyltransferase family 4 protein [Pararhizobium sp. BT-229]
MHLVFVSSLVPVESPSSGFDIANRAVLDGLRALGHRVSVVGYLQPGQTVAPGGDMHLLGELEVTNAKVGMAAKLRWLATAILNRTTLSSAKMLKVTPPHVEALLKGLQPFDGIILNSVQLPGAFASIFQKHPTIYVAHNVEADSALENAATASGILEKLLFQREAHYLERIERQLTHAASAIWTFNEADRFGFGYAVSDRASVLPLVTRWDLPENSAERLPAYDLALIGTWSWKPNRIGLDWFLSSVVPLLPADMTICIAGQLADAPSVSHPGVRFLGRVPDARAFVEAAAVVPLISRGGTGVQLKTVETFELGLPSVATRSSLRGVGELPGNCAVADDPIEFARLLIEKVAAVRAGKHQRLSGAAFQEAQKTRLLAVLEQGLSSFKNPAPAPGLAVPKDRPEPAKMKKPTVPYGFAVHGGGKSR